MRLKRKFFARPAEGVAPELLGKILVRRFPDGSVKKGIIIETEAYLGVEDKAAHSFGGRRTKRNEVMYGKAGVVYVYFTYGMHWLLNIIVSRVGDPQGVLIRGIIPIGRSCQKLVPSDVLVGTAGTRRDAPRFCHPPIHGPARVTKYFEIDGSFYGEDVAEGERLWMEEGRRVRRGDKGGKVTMTPRIGIDYAGDWKDKLLRFILK